MQRYSGSSTVQEYVIALGDALISLRRRLDTGQRTGKRVNSPQRIVRHVYPDNATAPSPDREGGKVHPATASDPAPSPPAIIQAEAMAAYTRSLLEPLGYSCELVGDDHSCPNRDDRAHECIA